MKKVLVFGTFDILHPGHLYFLREAKKHGDHLTVIVTPSAVVKRLKGAEPLFSDVHRVEAVRMMSFVNRVMIGDRTLSSFTVIKRVHPDIICLGYDQQELGKHIASYCRAMKQKIKLIHLKPYKPSKLKSAALKKILKHGVCLHCQL